jgi:hypothetical protein
VAFLLKCAFWLGLAFLLLPASAPRREAASVGRVRAQAVRPAAASARAVSEAKTGNALEALAADAAGRLAQAAQRRCLSQPKECLAGANALRRAAPALVDDSR